MLVRTHSKSEGFMAKYTTSKLVNHLSMLDKFFCKIRVVLFSYFFYGWRRKNQIKVVPYIMLFQQQQLGVDVAYDLGQGDLSSSSSSLCPLYKSKLGCYLVRRDVIFFRFAHSSLTFQNCVIS